MGLDIGYMREHPNVFSGILGLAAEVYGEG